MSTHPDRASTHQENRLKVCGPCGKKICLGQKKYSNFRLTETHEDLIKKLISDTYNLKDERFPLSICALCRIVLVQHGNKNCKRPLPKMPNYENILLPKATRMNSESTVGHSICNCYICLTGKAKSHNIIKGRKDVSTIISSSNGLYGSKNSTVTTLPKIEKSVKSNTIKICTMCRGEIHKGKKHNNCSTRDHVARKNVTKIVDKLPAKQQECIASKIISEKIKSDDGTDSLTLSTQGRKRRIFLKQKKNRGRIFSRASR